MSKGPITCNDQCALPPLRKAPLKFAIFVWVSDCMHLLRSYFLCCVLCFVRGERIGTKADKESFGSAPLGSNSVCVCVEAVG